MVDTIEIPKGYQKSEVGIIPNDWVVKKLSEVGESLIGLTYNPSNVKPYGKLVLRSSNVQNGKLAFGNNVFVEMDFPPRVIVKENDILICVRNGSRRLIGKCALINRKTAGSAFGAFMSVYRSEFSTFIFHQFQSFIIQWQINETLGATINQITNKDLASFRVPLPPTKDEQNIICNVLNDADKLITQLERLIEKKRCMMQGAMYQLLSPKVNWVEKTIAELSEVKSGKRLPLGKSLVSIKNSHPYIRVTDMFYGGVSLKEIMYVPDDVFPAIKNYRIFSDDIFISVAGTLGIVGKIPRELNGANLTENADMLTNISCDRDYLLFVLKSPFIQNKIETERTLGAQPKLALTRIRKFKIPLPPTRDEQIEIANILSEMEEEIQELEKTLEKQKMMKQGIMQSLLTGKIRLTNK